MKRITTAATALALALVLSACGTSGAPSSDAETPAGSASTNAPAESPEAVSESESDVAPFGKTWTYDDGLKITVTAPKAFKPSPYVTDSKLPSVRMDVTVTNDTGEPFDPTLVLVTATSGEAEAEELFDSEKGLNGSPSTSIRPGKKVTFPVGFSVKDPKDVLVEVTPGLTHDPATFTG